MRAPESGSVVEVVQWANGRIPTSSTLSARICGSCRTIVLSNINAGRRAARSQAELRPAYEGLTACCVLKRPPGSGDPTRKNAIGLYVYIYYL